MIIKCFRAKITEQHLDRILSPLSQTKSLPLKILDTSTLQTMKVSAESSALLTQSLSLQFAVTAAESALAHIYFVTVEVRIAQSDLISFKSMKFQVIC
jgi:hypothetical protein